MELMSIIALNINDYGLPFINIGVIEALSELKNIINEKKLKEQFLTDLLWRIRIHNLAD